MFCGKCGTQITQNERFCPRCGSAVNTNGALVQTNTPDPSWIPDTDTTSPNPTIVAKPKKRHTKPIIAGVAVLAAAVVGVTVTVNLIMKRPLAVFAAELEQLSSEMTEIESYHMEIAAELSEKMDGSFDIEINADSQEIYIYGTLEIMSKEMQLAACIEGNRGSYALENDGMVFGEEISGAQLDALWKTYDTQETKNISLEEYIRNLDISDEVEEYFDLDQIDEAYEKIMERFSKRSTQKELEEALAIEKDRHSGEQIYTITLNDDTRIETAELCLDILEEEAGDAIRGDWIDDAQSELKKETKGTDTYGSLEWHIKSGNLTSISFTNTEDIDMALTMDCTYRKDDLDEITFSLEYDDDLLQEISAELMLNEFNQVNDVKEMIPDNMMQQMEAGSTL